MLNRILRQLLVVAATLLTATGSLPVFYGTDGLLATVFVDTVDAGEEDDREAFGDRVSSPVVERAVYFSTLSVVSIVMDRPPVCGLHRERGPPLA